MKCVTNTRPELLEIVNAVNPQICRECKAPSTSICDWFKCDALLCGAHTYESAEGKDFCPKHRKQEVSE